VTQTSPASAPLAVVPMSGRPVATQAAVIAASAPAEAARVVLTAIRPVTGTAARVEPVLNPYQPNQSTNTPSTNRYSDWVEGTRWCRARRALPPPCQPIRGPASSAPASAVSPPVVCTTVEPAKSRNSRSASQPPPQIQCPTTG
jgi:hypothetical protein